jgi:hypothetical protein
MAWGIVIKACISGMLMLSVAIPALAQTATFVDPSTGVSFRYPAEWKRAAGNQFYSPPAMIPQAAQVRGAVVWNADKPPRTTLAGTQFLYAFQKGASSAACLHPHSEGDSAKANIDMVRINGISYAHNHSVEAGMCHQEQEDIYTTYLDNACYLFDLSVHTICSGVVDGMRDATESELAEARARLVDILKTVRLGPAKPATIH